MAKKEKEKSIASLLESEERYRGLSEASLEAVLVHDGGRIVDVNHALCELGGYAWHELIGRNAFELIAPEDQERVYRSLLVESERPHVIMVTRKNGSRIPVEMRGRSFPFRGQVLRVVALRDISERTRAEAVLQARTLAPTPSSKRPPGLSARSSERRARSHTSPSVRH